jgi:hypothetical protein
MNFSFDVKHFLCMRIEYEKSLGYMLSTTERVYYLKRTKGQFSGKEKSFRLCMHSFLN